MQKKHSVNPTPTTFYETFPKYEINPIKVQRKKCFILTIPRFPRVSRPTFSTPSSGRSDEMETILINNLTLRE